MSNSVLAEARGWSAATLLVAIPLAIVALWTARRGSLRGRLVWLGTLAYFLYTYLEFAVSPPFTLLYLFYVAAFACAIPALVMGLGTLDIAALPVAFGQKTPRRTVAVFSLLLASLLAVAWLKGIVSRSLAGSFGWPGGADAVGHVVHALDLGLQVPLGIATGALLLRRRPTGLLLAAIMLVNGVCMGAALTAMVLCSTADKGTSAWRAGPFAMVWVVGVLLAVVFFRAGVETTRGRAAPLAMVAKVLIGLQVFLALGALVGGAILFVSPDGSAFRMPLSMLEHSGFTSFRSPGLVLFVVNGVFLLISALAIMRRRPWASLSTMAVGVLLVGWITVQVALLRSFEAPLRVTYLILGVAISALGLALHRSASLPGSVNVCATAEERQRVLPGDELLQNPMAALMHAVTIDAPAARVWPWLVQMGAGRAGWYSYDWVDNGRTQSAISIVPELQHVAPGDVLSSLPGLSDSFVVAAVEVDRDLILTVPAAGGGLLVSWEFFLEPLACRSTRLLVRGRVSSRWPAGGRGHRSASPRPIERLYALLASAPQWLMAPAARFGHFLMQGRQLRGIKRRVEATERAQTTVHHGDGAPCFQTSQGAP